MTHPDFPFCSERCRLIDLGKWASEEYVISTPVQPDDLARERNAGSVSNNDED